MWRKLLTVTAALAILLMIGAWRAASAQEFRSGNNASVRSGEVIDSSVWAYGRTVDIAGQVNGDVYCAGQNVTVSGTINGDLLCAAQTIVVSGTVNGNVRSAGQTITVTGTVSHNLTALAQSFSQNGKSSVGGDASVGATDASLNGSVGRDAAIASQSALLNGKVSRNMKANVNKLRLGSSANIGGNLNYTSPNDAQIASGAIVTGKTTKTTPQGQPATHKVFQFSIGFAVYALIAGIITALVLVLLFPQFFRAVADRGFESFWKSLLVGLIACIVVPIIIVLLFATVIGIPLALLAFVAWMLVQILAGFMAAFYLGRQILRGRRNALLVMLVGSAILIILYLIPIVGYIAFILALFLGTGMLLREISRRRPAPDYQT